MFRKFLNKIFPPIDTVVGVKVRAGEDLQYENTIVLAHKSNGKWFIFKVE